MSAEKEKKRRSRRISPSDILSAFLRLHPVCLLQPSLKDFIVKQQCSDSIASETYAGFLLANELTNIINILYESSSFP